MKLKQVAPVDLPCLRFRNLSRYNICFRKHVNITLQDKVVLFVWSEHWLIEAYVRATDVIRSCLRDSCVLKDAIRSMLSHAYVEKTIVISLNRRRTH